MIIIGAVRKFIFRQVELKNKDQTIVQIILSSWSALFDLQREKFCDLCYCNLPVITKMILYIQNDSVVMYHIILYSNIICYIIYVIFEYYYSLWTDIKD